MKIALRSIVFAIWVVLSVCTTEADQSRSNPFSGEWRIFTPETVLMAKYGDDDIRIEIGVQEVDFRDPICSTLGDLLYSTCPNERHRCTCTSINYIRILFNDKAVSVNCDVYSGLLDLNRGEIRKEEDRYFLYLSGGDGTYSWTVRLEFGENSVKSEYDTIGAGEDFN